MIFFNGVKVKIFGFEKDSHLANVENIKNKFLRAFQAFLELSWK